jgi:hypothetical protein
LQRHRPAQEQVLLGSPLLRRCASDPPIHRRGDEESYGGNLCPS